MSTALALQPESLDRYMAEVGRHPLLSRGDEVALARRFRDHGDVSAAHELVVSNLRFVVKIAYQYKGYGLKLLDLIQEGNIGLMVAVKKFDPDRGYRLISYAVWWIRAYIQSYVMRSWSLVRMGGTRVQRKLFFRLRSERAKAEKEGLESQVSASELASRLNVPEHDVQDMELRLASRDFSLDAKVSDESMTTHLDSVVEPQENQEEALGRAEEIHELRGKVQVAMEGFNEKERYVVENRLLTDEPKTLQEIGHVFDVSRERVRQLETRVISKLRASLQASAQPA